MAANPPTLLLFSSASAREKEAQKKELAGQRAARRKAKKSARAKRQQTWQWAKPEEQSHAERTKQIQAEWPTHEGYFILVRSDVHRGDIWARTADAASASSLVPAGFVQSSWELASRTHKSLADIPIYGAKKAPKPAPKPKPPRKRAPAAPPPAAKPKPKPPLTWRSVHDIARGIVHMGKPPDAPFPEFALNEQRLGEWIVRSRRSAKASLVKTGNASTLIGAKAVAEDQYQRPELTQLGRREAMGIEPPAPKVPAAHAELERLEAKAKIKKRKVTEARPARMDGARLLAQRDVHVRMTIPGKYASSTKWVIVDVSEGLKRVKVALGSDTSKLGPKFAGKQYTFSWDGTGFRRQGQYLHTDGIYSHEGLPTEAPKPPKAAREQPTPGFNKRMRFAFTADKRGRPIAYYWSQQGFRWIRTGYDEAKLAVAQDQADEVPYTPRPKPERAEKPAPAPKAPAREPAAHPAFLAAQRSESARKRIRASKPHAFTAPIGSWKLLVHPSTKRRGWWQATTFEGSTPIRDIDAESWTRLIDALKIDAVDWEGATAAAAPAPAPAPAAKGWAAELAEAKRKDEQARRQLIETMATLKARDRIAVYTEQRTRAPWKGRVLKVAYQGADLVGPQGGQATIVANIHDPGLFTLILGRSIRARTEVITRIEKLGELALAPKPKPAPKLKPAPKPAPKPIPAGAPGAPGDWLVWVKEPWQTEYFSQTVSATKEGAQSTAKALRQAKPSRSIHVRRADQPAPGKKAKKGKKPEIKWGTTKVTEHNGQSVGIDRVSTTAGKRWMALTTASSKMFKTLGGAARWLEKRGYAPDGTRIAKPEPAPAAPAPKPAPAPVPKRAPKPTSEMWDVHEKATKLQRRAEQAWHNWEAYKYKGGREDAQKRAERLDERTAAAWREFEALEQQQAAKPAQKPAPGEEKGHFILSRIDPSGRVDYVSSKPGEDGKDWGYTSDLSQAKVLSAHWKRRFEKYVGDVGGGQVRATPAPAPATTPKPKPPAPLPKLGAVAEKVGEEIGARGDNFENAEAVYRQRTGDPSMGETFKKLMAGWKRGRAKFEQARQEKKEQQSKEITWLRQDAGEYYGSRFKPYQTFSVSHDLLAKMWTVTVGEGGEAPRHLIGARSNLARAKRLAEDFRGNGEAIAKASAKEEKREAYAEKKESKADRMRARAEKKRGEAGSLERSNKMLGEVMAGSPILIGHHSEKRHRRDLERMHTRTRKSIDLRSEAASLEHRAATVESSRAIDSDDPDALEKLRGKLESVTKTADEMVRHNKMLGRQRRDMTDAQLAKARGRMEAAGVSERTITAMLTPDVLYSGRKDYGISGYEITNRRAEARRLKERIAELEKRKGTEGKEKTIGEVRIVEEENRVRMLFPGKPEADVRKELKSAGFRWSPRAGAWQRKPSGMAWYYAERIANKLAGNPPEGINPHRYHVLHSGGIERLTTKAAALKRGKEISARAGAGAAESVLVLDAKTGANLARYLGGKAGSFIASGEFVPAGKKPKRAARGPRIPKTLRAIGRVIARTRARQEALPMGVKRKLRAPYRRLSDRLETLQRGYDDLLRKKLPHKVYKVPSTLRGVAGAERRVRAKLDELGAAGEHLYSGSLRYHRIFDESVALEEARVGHLTRRAAREGKL